MGPEAAVNAVFANKIAAIEDPAEREAFVAEQRKLYEEDVDLLPAGLRARDRRRRRLRGPARRDRPPPGPGRGQGPHFSDRRHGVPPSTVIEPVALAWPGTRRGSRTPVVIRDVGPRDGLQPEAPVEPRRPGAADRGPGRRRGAPHRGGRVRVAQGRAGHGRCRRGAGRRAAARPTCATRPWCPTCGAPSWRWPPTSTS